MSEKVEFSQFVISLAHSIKEGLVEGASESSKTMAYYSLKTLEMLKHKTKGNLNSEEESLLDAVLKEFETELAKD